MRLCLDLPVICTKESMKLLLAIPLLLLAGCQVTRQLDVTFKADGSTTLHYCSTIPVWSQTSLDSAELTTRPVGIKINGVKSQLDPATANLLKTAIDDATSKIP